MIAKGQLVTIPSQKTTIVTVQTFEELLCFITILVTGWFRNIIVSIIREEDNIFMIEDLSYSVLYTIGSFIVNNWVDNVN